MLGYRGLEPIGPEDCDDLNALDHDALYSDDEFPEGLVDLGDFTTRRILLRYIHQCMIEKTYLAPVVPRRLFPTFDALPANFVWNV